MIRHLYIHIPYCPKICPYCSFYKQTIAGANVRRFLDALLEEAGRWASRLQPRTIFFGGGTPTALSNAQLEYLLEGLRMRLDLSRVREWTFEMNPATVSLSKARRLLTLGVNRFSMGVQSWEPDLLRTLGRVHSAHQARKSFEILREAGCNNINLDLIFGIPGQSETQWRETLRQTIALQPDHISAYCLTYEEDTAYFESLQRGEFVVDEEIERTLFLVTRQTLAAAGYHPYEISNFSRPGKECAHNLAYWRGEDYLGLGPSAFSTVGGRRWRNVRDTDRYTCSTLQGQTETDFHETVHAETRHNERIAFALRTSLGIPAGWIDPEVDQRLVRFGLLEPAGNRRTLTEQGVLVADAVAAELLGDGPGAG